MAKRGRRSIRNKRKSVKKYSSKRRSKTMRYLRGGVGPIVFDDDDDDMTPGIHAGLKKAAANYKSASPPNISLQNCINGCNSNMSEAEYYKCRTDCNRLDQTSKGIKFGGRRRYHRRKQSKTRKH
jgi:hypothetical protein